MQIIVDIFLAIVYITLFLLMVAWTWKFWTLYIAQKFIMNLNNNSVMLEIKLPREIYKSPEAMEIVATAFIQGGGVAEWYKRNWLGNLVTFFSLEIASIEGDVKFFVRTEKKFRQLIVNNFYSQYPGIEIVEAEDYIKKIFYEHRSENVVLWGINNKLGATFTLPKTVGSDRESAKDDDLKMPADFKKLKTYIDYRLEKDPKEEYKNDPLTPILEWMGSLKKGEYGWYQLIVQDPGKFEGKTFSKTYKCEATHEDFTLQELAAERRRQLRKTNFKKIKTDDVVKDNYGYSVMIDNPDYKEVKDPVTGVVTKTGGEKRIPLKYSPDFFTDEEKKKGYKLIDDGKTMKELDITDEAKEEIEMINRKLQKPLVRAVMRVMYIAKKDEIDIKGGRIGENVNSTMSMFRGFTGAGYNSFAPTPTDPYKYSWDNAYKRRVPWRAEEMFENYAERDGFYPHLPDRSEQEIKLLKYFNMEGLDWYADVYLFKYSFAFRKTVRMLYEAVFYPFDHLHPNNVFTINLEELASLWHLPGTTATTPGIKRVDSVKSDAPDNLPR